MLRRAFPWALVICLALVGLVTMEWAQPPLSHAKAPAGTLTRVTAGSQTIVDKNIPGARDKAVSQALERAVQNAVAELVSPQVFAANLEFLYDRILPKSQEYLVTFRVLGGVEHKGKYRVGVESTIHLGLLEKTLTDARILHAGTDKPRLLFLIAEQTPESLLPRYWWGQNPQPYISLAESTLASRLMEDRYPLVGQGPERPDPAQYNIQFATIYDAASALALGRELSADMVILGRAQSGAAMNRKGDEKAFDAQLRLEVYEVASGTKVADAQGRAVAASDMDQEGSVLAMVRAAEETARDLTAKLDEFWTRNLRKENTFEVAVHGEEFLPRYIALKNRFREMQDIENFQPKEVGSDQALLDMVYKGSPDLFADTVMLKTFDGFGLEVDVVSDGLVTIRFIEEMPEPLSAPLQSEAQNLIPDQGDANPNMAPAVEENLKKEGETP
ncbi:MAG: hypothetical protein MI747_18925 [Desulfobacterales bacterium]|nr:hypothetical protein [Desulfobacterales bacterium]